MSRIAYIYLGCSTVSFLEKVISQMKETKQTRLEQPLLYLRLQIARTKLESGDSPGCASVIDEGKDELDIMQDVSNAAQLLKAFRMHVHVSASCASPL